MPKSATGARHGMRRINRHRSRCQPTPGNHLSEQASEGMPDDDRLSLELFDDGGVVIRDLTDGLVRKDLGMGVRLPPPSSGSSGQPGVSGA